MATLWLLRHGESASNADGKFTGWLDVPLTARGRHEAAAAGSMMLRAGASPDVVHTSLLRRTVTTAEITLNRLGRDWLPVIRTWRLNERHYGALTGRTKRDVLDEAGEELFNEWRRSRSTRPPTLDAHDARALHFAADPRYRALRDGVGLPLTESLDDVQSRLLPHWTDVLVQQLTAGRTPLVVAHGNSLRALIAHLDRLDDEEVRKLNVPTGVPLRYDLDSSLRPVHRGGTYLNEQTADGAEVPAVVS